MSYFLQSFKEMLENTTNPIVLSAKKALMSKSVSIHHVTKEDCDIAFMANTNSAMQTIRFVHLFFCSFGVLASSLFIYVLAQRSSRNLHVNLRMSLGSLACAAWIACVQLLIIACHSLYLTFVENDPCLMMHETFWCAVMRFPVVLSIYSTLSGIFALAIERTIATVKYRTYEATGSFGVALALIIVQWSMSLIVAVVSVLLRSDDGFVHYCTVYVSHPRTAVISLCLMSLLEAGVLVYFVLLLQSNQRRQVNEFVNKAMHTLTERYQLQENVRIMRIMIPSVTVHAVLGLFGLISLLAFAIAQSAVEERLLVHFAPYSELVLLVVPVYAIVFPLVAVSRNGQLRHAAQRALPWLTNNSKLRSDSLLPYEDQHSIIANRPSRQMEMDSDTHFDLLNEMWKK